MQRSGDLDSHHETLSFSENVRRYRQAFHLLKRSLPDISAEELSVSQRVQAGRISGADGLRALACLWVFFHHAAIQMDPPSLMWHDALHTQGMLGVAVFFVLSGLLLTLPFWQAQQGQRPWPSMLSYAMARMGRVVPAYFVCLFLCWQLSPSSPDMGLRIGSAVTFMNWLHWKTYFPSPINAALWSIGIEVWFYVMLPVWAIGLRVCSGWRSSALYWGVTQLLIVAVQILILNRIQPGNLDSNTLDSLQLHAQQLVPSKNPLGLFSHFLFGSAAAGCLVAMAGTSARSDAGSSRWNRFDLLGLACLGALAILVHPAMLPGAEWSSWVSRTQIWAMHYQWPLFPALVAVLLVAMSHSKLLGRLFDNWLLSGVCKLSYGIYLWHMVVLKLFCSYCPWSLETLPRQIAASFVALSITVILAAISYRLIELPAMELLKRGPRASAPRPQLAKA